MLMDNSKYTKSLATKKILWTGEGGAFAKRDLVHWFKVYNQTKLNKVSGQLKSEKEANQKRLAYSNKLAKVEHEALAEKDNVIR